MTSGFTMLANYFAKAETRPVAAPQRTLRSADTARSTNNPQQRQLCSGAARACLWSPRRRETPAQPRAAPRDRRRSADAVKHGKNAVPSTAADAAASH